MLTKRWRFVAVFSDEVMLCVGAARVGPLPTAWWAVWDRGRGRLHERTWRGPGGVRFDGPRATVRDRGAGLTLEVREGAAVEVTCGPVWTRKQAGRPARGAVRLPGRLLRFEGRAVVDETAGRHPHHTAWWWSAGVGAATDGTPVAWNLVDGVNDPPQGSERAIWAGDEPREVGPVVFDGLDGVAFAEGGALCFTPEATRERHDNLGLVSSDYVQPFGTFSGELPGGLVLACGVGVMERHVARW